MKPANKSLLTIMTIILAVVLLWLAQTFLDDYKKIVLILAGINVILAVSLNLINGFTGQFSLGHAGFMALGAYTTALLTMPPEVKSMNFFSTPLWGPLQNITLPFILALFIGGLIAAAFGLLIGFPVFRLKGDYLAIATLGFAEVIRVVVVNAKSITNGALGLKGIPPITNLYWAWGMAIFAIIFIMRLINSSYGLALKSINMDEIASEAMGVNLFKHKMLAFGVSSFFAGIGGGLLSGLLGTVDPTQFTFLVTFNILLIVVLGGMGSITGSVLAGLFITIIMEWLRFVEAPISIGTLFIPGIPGMRMVIFSFLLILVIIYYQRGLMGTREFNWDAIFKVMRKSGGDKQGPKSEVA